MQIHIVVKKDGKEKIESFSDIFGYRKVDRMLNYFIRSGKFPVYYTQIKDCVETPIEQLLAVVKLEQILLYTTIRDYKLKRKPKVYFYEEYVENHFEDHPTLCMEN